MAMAYVSCKKDSVKLPGANILPLKMRGNDTRIISISAHYSLYVAEPPGSSNDKVSFGNRRIKNMLSQYPKVHFIVFHYVN
jgi:hypothetical protein